MKCRLCGKSALEIQGYIERVNEYGVPGIGECRPFCGAALSLESRILGGIEGSGTSLALCVDIERLKADVEFLWGLLDDIDTASDIAKNNDRWYRNRVEAIQKKRHQRVITDGHTLFLVPG